MKSYLARGCGLVLLGLAGTFSVQAEVSLPSIFSEHAVLQKSAKVPVWGKAEPGEAVTVALDGTKAQTQAGADGKWRVALDLKDKAEGPFELIVEGKNKLVIPDVLVGDVWVCSGQSNMEWVLKNTLDGDEEIAKSANPRFRQFCVKKNTSPEPLDTVAGRWIVAAPETAEAFSAVGYYFGKQLNAELNKPIGLLHTAWGGTPSEAWTSAEALGKDPELKERMESLKAAIAAYPDQLKEYQTQYAAWLAKYNRADQPAPNAKSFAAPDAAAAGWKPVTLPGLFAKASLPEAGAVWLRKKITVPEEAAGKNLRLELGVIRDADEVYWNGEKIGGTGLAANGNPPIRRYDVPANLVKAGEATIAIRVFTQVDGAGVEIPKNGVFKAGTTDLSGEWLAKVERELPPLEAAAKAEHPAEPARPMAPQLTASFLYNAMIHPLQPYAIEGAIWYQGESNAGRAYQYRKAFPMLIQDWRAQWGQGDFPFYFCQLANYRAKRDVPEESDWAELREAQTQTLALPNTGMAVL
ncbi:MAG TPA: sialate O-acetylesterase, partial [Chthoniobacterales bacterium]